jgi:hypothetical protein
VEIAYPTGADQTLSASRAYNQTHETLGSLNSYVYDNVGDSDECDKITECKLLENCGSTELLGGSHDVWFDTSVSLTSVRQGTNNFIKVNTDAEME